jgi:hypothetical protein
MKGIEKVYTNLGIKSVVTAWSILMGTSVEEASSLRKYGKSDTLGMDAIPEISIKKCIEEFTDEAILVTEETDEITTKYWPKNPDPFLQPPIFFSDPVDRSKFLKKFLVERAKDKFAKVGEILSENGAIEFWEEKIGSRPAIITGATISITCVIKGRTLFSVILNIVTQTIFIACPAGVFQMKLPRYSEMRKLEEVNLDYITKAGRAIIFSSAKKVCKTPDDFKRFATFLGKSGYRENFNDSMIFLDNPDKYLHHVEPGGPSRALYLSEFQNGSGPVGFILANGEKIGEWVHWLPFVKYAKNLDGGRALKIFEISIERPWTKEAILMSAAPPYSVFRHKKGEDCYFNISRLRDFDKPSHFRSMIVVTPYDNERIISIMHQNGYREVSESF